MNIKDLVGFSKPLEKFIDVCASGMGRAVEPGQIRKRADAKAYEIKVMTKALADSKKKLGCNATYENGDVKLVVDKSGIEEVEVIEDNTSSQIVTAQTKIVEEATSSNEIEMFNNDMERRVHYKNLKKEKNIYNTLNFTMNEFEDTSDEDVSDEEVDEDWITRFFNTIEDVNNEKLQQLWAKILAGEIKQPNTYSLRTLELLRNLTFNEAELFSKVANFVIQNINKSQTFILSEESILSKFNISFQDIITLQDLDLIHPNKLTVNLAPSTYDHTDFLTLGKELISIDLPKHSKYSLSVYMFSSIGKELLNLVEREINTNYKKELSIQIKKIIKL